MKGFCDAERHLQDREAFGTCASGGEMTVHMSIVWLRESYRCRSNLAIRLTTHSSDLATILYKPVLGQH